jgi:hypothetical protein
MTKNEVVALLRQYLTYLKPGGRIVAITPQEAGYRSDPTHVEFMDWEKMADVLESLRVQVVQQYSFPLPRVFGFLFKHNEFITIGQKPSQREQKKEVRSS